ncbi:hypothetical protein MKX03_006584 [Papaver bracteatum]|nr:hypothetical protein MKX03_006584 [Papaver bracteatum]
MYKMDFLMVDSLIITGVMDCDDFKTKLLVNKGKPAIINVNIETLKVAGFSEDRFYIHCHLSISVSGHKFIGSPTPCDIQITRLDRINAMSRNVKYIASRDAIITRTRYGHAPIFLCYTLNIQTCLRNARYLKDRLCSEGISGMLNEFKFVRHWKFACHGNIAQVVVMQNVTIMILDEFLNDQIMKRSIWLQDKKVKPTCVGNTVLR